MAVDPATSEVPRCHPGSLGPVFGWASAKSDPNSLTFGPGGQLFAKGECDGGFWNRVERSGVDGPKLLCFLAQTAETSYKADPDTYKVILEDANYRVIEANQKGSP